MRKSVILLLLLSACFGRLFAEEAYRPMLEEGKQWSCYLGNSFREYRYNFYIKGDTIVDEEKCFKMYADFTDMQTGNLISTSSGAYLEKDRRVYLVTHQRKELLCDFNLKVGDKKPGTNQQVIAIDSIYVQGVIYRRFHLTEPGEFEGEVEEGYWVEGIGSSRGLLDTAPSWAATGGMHKLMACYENGVCIFTSEDFKAAPITSCIKEASRPAITNSQRSSSTFDLQGRRINGEPKHGLYIRDGKKVIKF
jgi:hypothetical protein